MDINWNISADEIKQLTKQTIEDCKRRCAQIANVQELTYENLLIPLNENEIEFENTNGILRFLGFVVSRQETVGAINESIRELSKFSIEMKMRKDLFDIISKFSETNTENISTEAKRYVSRLITEGKKNGLHLNDDKRDEIKKIKEKISTLEIQCLSNFKTENPVFAFKSSELAGVSQNIISELDKNESGEILVTLRYPVYYPIMRECQVPETRRKLLIEFESRCASNNVQIIEELIILRNKLASILDYKTYGDYVLELCVAKKPENVSTFIEKLANRFQILREEEKKIFLELKKAECNALNIEFDGKIHQYEIDYYTNMRLKTEFSINRSEIQEYFPTSAVSNGIFLIYQKLLGLKFQQLDIETYHKDIKLYEVRDKETDEILGYFGTDLHPREGKFGHMANFPIRRGCLRQDGKRQKPVCIMACNFTPATKDKPALLTHDEVEVFFHEFGHVMHHMCAKTNFMKFSGTHVEVDFVEGPSQMLENWVWEKETLKIMSKHYKNGQEINESLIDNLIKSRNSGASYKYLYRIVKSKMDHEFHQQAECNTKDVYQKHLKEIMGVDVEDEKMNLTGAFGHILDGYDARFYSYLWSEVYSYDMFRTRFRKEGILNEKTGMDYRRFILEPGGTLDAEDMLFNFLGRKPTEDAFYEGKGLISK